MNTIKLTPEQLEELKELENVRNAALETIEHLSVKAIEYKKRFWERLKSWHPEIDTEKNQYRLNIKNGELSVINL